MSIQFTCEKCGKEYRKISSRFAGRKVKCSCGHKCRLPDDDKRQAEMPLIADDFSDLDALLE